MADFCTRCGAGFPPKDGELICTDWQDCERTQNKFRTADNGRTVEFSEGVWENAEFTDVVGGYPISVRRTF